MNIRQAREKATAIVSAMTVEEKASQLIYNAPAIERLGIHEHNWWNEALHGVARAGVATVFPQSIGLAATFNEDLVYQVADTVSTEARAKYNKSVQFGDYDIYKGLTYWTPNINIFRDPRWGRGQETFGEDPWLTARMGTQFVHGLQGSGEFLKSAACAKHFAVHSGPEPLRHEFDAIASEQDMRETYLPAFHELVKEGVMGVMGAYNRTNGEPCCASPRLQKILREEWGFEGYFVSDCGAVSDISNHHKLVANRTEAAALALNNGCDLNCGSAYRKLMDAYEEDLITEEQITEAAVRLYTIRVMLGEFEDDRPYSDIAYQQLDAPEHRQLNLEAAQQSLVLLKNEDNFLPLNPSEPLKIAVVGPNAMSFTALEGNYNGRASEYITPVDGIRQVFPNAHVTVATGSDLCIEERSSWHGFRYLHTEGAAAASEADITVLCLGLDRTIEGEETGVSDDFTDGGDKKSLGLPAPQLKLAKAVCDVCDNVIVVLMSGSSIDVGPEVASKAKAIIQAWYPGALGGLAIARLLGGHCNPSGKLPMTFCKINQNLPPLTDYSMEGRTYRFMRETPLYPFGFGLSYTTFAYDHVTCAEMSDSYRITANVSNTGDWPGWAKLQVYASYTDSRTRTPNFQLCGLRPIYLLPGETKSVTLYADKRWIQAVLPDGTRVTPDGRISLFFGDHQPDDLSTALSGNSCVEMKIK